MNNPLLAVLFLLAVVLLVACGSNGSTSSAAPASSPAASAVTPSPTQGVDATATVEETRLIQQMKLVGTPIIKISGSNYTISGNIKNGDSKKHDIYVTATLLDASGKEVLTSTIFKVEDLDGGDIGPYTITGTNAPTNTKGLNARVSVMRVTFSY